MNHVRQLDLFDPRVHGDKFSIHVIGCGGVGSFTTQMLAKMGWKRITAWDFDRVEEHNQPNQNFSTKDIGKYKVDAMTEIVYRDTGVIITPISNAFDIDQFVQTSAEVDDEVIVVIAVDSIDTRKKIYKDIVESNTSGNVVLVIDSRIGALMYEVFAHDPRVPSQREAFESTMAFSSEQATQLPCTGRAIIYIGHLVASEECLMIRNWACGKYNSVGTQYTMAEMQEYARNTEW